MYNLLDLNDDCLFEIVSKLTCKADRLSLFVVLNRFWKLLEKDLLELDPEHLYHFLRALDSNTNRNTIELICSFVKELNLGELNSDTVDYFEDFGKYLTNLEALTLKTSNTLFTSEENEKLEQHLKPILERLKVLHFSGGRTNLIGYTKNLKTARLNGRNLLDSKDFSNFLKNNQKTLQYLDYTDISLNILNDETIKIISNMKCLKEMKLFRICVAVEYFTFKKVLASRNTANDFYFCLGLNSDYPLHWLRDSSNQDIIKMENYLAEQNRKFIIYTSSGKNGQGLKFELAK